MSVALFIRRDVISVQEHQEGRMAVFHEYLDGVVLMEKRHKGFKSLPATRLDIYLDCGWYLCDYLQQETHEKGLSDVIIKPASALA